MTRPNPSDSEPWLARKDWARGEVVSSDRKGLVVLWMATLFWNGVSWPMLFAFTRNAPKDNAGWIPLIFPVIGVIMAGVAARATLRHTKFGNSIFKMLSVPGAIGGNLSGVIQTNTKILPEDGFNIRLKCLKRETTGSGKNKRTVERLLWEDYKTLRAEMLQEDQRRSGIPVFFQIPKNGRETNSAESILWRLEVEAKVPGIDYKTTFEVPVFRLAEIPASKISENEFAARFEASSNPKVDFGKVGIRVEEGAGATTRFSYARARNALPTWNTLVFFLIFGLVSYFLWNTSSFVPKLFAGLFSVVTILFLWGMGECLLKSVDVTISAEGLQVRTNRVYWNREVSVSARDIKKIEAHSSLQVGDTRYFQIRVRARTDSPLGFRTIIAGDGIKGRKEADWIVEKMYSALNLSRSHEAAQNPQK